MRAFSDLKTMMSDLSDIKRQIGLKPKTPYYENPRNMPSNEPHFNTLVKNLGLDEDPYVLECLFREILKSDNPLILDVIKRLIVVAKVSLDEESIGVTDTARQCINRIKDENKRIKEENDQRSIQHSISIKAYENKCIERQTIFANRWNALLDNTIKEIQNNTASDSFWAKAVMSTLSVSSGFNKSENITLLEMHKIVLPMTEVFCAGDQTKYRDLMDRMIKKHSDQVQNVYRSLVIKLQETEFKHLYEELDQEWSAFYNRLVEQRRLDKKRKAGDDELLYDDIYDRADLNVQFNDKRDRIDDLVHEKAMLEIQSYQRAGNDNFDDIHKCRQSYF